MPNAYFAREGIWKSVTDSIDGNGIMNISLRQNKALWHLNYLGQIKTKLALVNFDLAYI